MTLFLVIFGGGGEIRTLEALRLGGFQDRWNKPLSDSSKRSKTIDVFWITTSDYFKVFVYICKRLWVACRPTATTHTPPAPASFSTRAACWTVAPVVMMSSTIT